MAVPVPAPAALAIHSRQPQRRWEKPHPPRSRRNPGRAFLRSRGPTSPTSRPNPLNSSAFHRQTKPLLHDYGYRYYDPVTGRWPSRDPLEENHRTREYNPYAFILNRSQGYLDVLGLLLDSVTQSGPAGGAAVGSAIVRETAKATAKKGAGNGLAVVGTANAVLVGAGLTAAHLTSKDEDEKSCCRECVTGVKFIKGSPTQSREGLLAFSYTVEVSRTLTKVESGKGGDAVMRWTEKVDQDGRLPNSYRRYLDPENPNFIDLTAIDEVVRRSKEMREWNMRTGLCPHSDLLRLRDDPGANPTEFGDRTLRIQISFTNPPGCANRGFTVTIVHDVSTSPRGWNDLQGGTIGH